MLWKNGLMWLSKELFWKELSFLAQKFQIIILQDICSKI